MKKQISHGRRNLLKGIAGAQAAPFLAALAALQSKDALAANTLIDSPYGDIVPTADTITGLMLLQLPPGFSYQSFGWAGDQMADGRPCPSAHDGMGVIAYDAAKQKITLVRNHEGSTTSLSSAIQAPAIYSRSNSGSTPAGGTTTLTFKGGKWNKMEASLGGTYRNCAGGVTPWGSWLTCEEDFDGYTSPSGKKHGYVFEVHANPKKTKATPIVGMGRFAHEAAAVDPANGVVYMTEDSEGRSGFYRYIPNVSPGAYGTLAQGGTLQMAKVKGQINTSLISATSGTVHELEWVSIANPDQARGTARGPTGITIGDTSGPFIQGWAGGGLRMNRGEGAWQFGGKIYVMDTEGGAARKGAVWELDLAAQTFKCIFVTPNIRTSNMGDNITVSPGGGLLMCEDGETPPGDQFGPGERLMGLSAGGDSYIFAKNNCNLSRTQVLAAGKNANTAGDNRTAELAGCCFDPTGKYLFVNIYTPGITCAITGPWEKGPLKSSL
jgi:uncharacterized protein